MRLPFRLSLAFAALLSISCGDDSSSAPSDDDDKGGENEPDSGTPPRMDGSVRVTDASTDANVRRDAATHDAASAVVDASADAGAATEDAGGVACFLSVCSNPFDCLRNVSDCGKIICNMEKNVCE